MLLPSALPCSPQTPLFSRPSRPKLASSVPYLPVQQAQNAATSLLASCRALQAILGHAPAPASASLSSPAPPSHRISQARSRSGLRHEWHVNVHTDAKDAALLREYRAPRGLNKRRRDESEEDQEMLDTSEEKENFERIYVTPKRHRKAPLLLPLGLSAQDFNALGDPTSGHSEELSLPPAGPQVNSSATHKSLVLDGLGDWTAADDRLLVETVLEKLKLSKREWNDCARRLGKDKDTLGKRWKMLVVEGNVGLRRGGRLRRTDLDIESW